MSTIRCKKTWAIARRRPILEFRLLGVFGFAATKGGEPLAITPETYDASPPIISYSGNYRLEGNDLAAKVDLVWEDGWPRTDELHHYRSDGDKRLVETTHLRYPNAFGSRMTSTLIWERE